MITTAILLAGGFGTRLQSVITDVPKPMAPINKLPFLNYQLNYLKYYGVKQVIISTGYLAEIIKNYYGEEYNGLTIVYSHETSPMGTGGGIRLALEKADTNQVFVLNGDSFFDVDLNQFYNQHYEHNADFSIAVRKVKNAGRYGSIELVPYFLSISSTKTTDNFFKVNSFNEKNENTNEGIINGGIYILNNKQFFKYTNANDAFSIEKNFFETQCLKIDMGAFLSNGYFIDIGIPEDYQKAQDDFKNFKYK